MKKQYVETTIRINNLTVLINRTKTNNQTFLTLKGTLSVISSAQRSKESSHAETNGIFLQLFN